MPEPTPAPTEPTNAPIDNQTPAEPTSEPQEPVKNPEAVLAKNKELLAKLAAEKQERETLASRLAEFEAKEKEREIKALEKKGEFEKLFEIRKSEFESQLKAKDAEIEAIFNETADNQLKLAIAGNSEIFEDAYEDFAAVLRAKYLKSERENGKVVWKSLDGLETYDLKEFIPSLRNAHGRFFKANNIPGSNAPGNSGKVPTGQLRRSQMSTSEKSAYTAKHGLNAFLALPE